MQVMSTENKIQSFSMYAVLEKPLNDFLSQGDGISVLPVFDERQFPDAKVVDVSLINWIRTISTAFGRKRMPQAYKIVERIKETNGRKKTLRFRSPHPLYTNGTPKDQNYCLVSAMVYLEIPILPYFDGMNVLAGDEIPPLIGYDDLGDAPALIY